MLTVALAALFASAAVASPRSAADRLQTGGRSGQFVNAVAKAEAQARRLLAGLPDRQEPLARRCVQEKLGRIQRHLKRARAAQARLRRGRSWQSEVELTRAYIEAIILNVELDRCRELVGLLPSGRRNMVQLEIDPSIPSSDPTQWR